MTIPLLYPGPTPDDLARLPDVLKVRPQWMLWRAADKIDKQTGAVIGLNKMPYQTTNPDEEASSTNPTTWSSYADAVAGLPTALETWELSNPAGYRGGGLGYVFTVDDPFCGVDLDHSVDPATGVVADWAQLIVQGLASYTQRSCSGTGLHVLVEGTLPPGRRQAGDVQMWDQRRFFAMTGWHLPETPATIEPRQGLLDSLWCYHFGAQVGDLVWCVDDQGTITNAVPWALTTIDHATDGTPYARFAETPTGWPLTRCQCVSASQLIGQPLSPPMDDATILEKARAAKNGEKCVALLEGRWQPYGYPSESEADLALLTMLVFWTQDPAQLARLFEQSALCDEKWLTRPDYQQRTLRKALDGCTEHYQPPASPAGNDAAERAQRAQQAADALLRSLAVLPEDQREDVVYDAIQGVIDLTTIPWMKLRRQLKTLVPALNWNSLEKARNELKREAAHQAAPAFPAGDWRGLLKVTKRGDVQALLNNIILILEHDTAWTEVLGFDALEDAPMLLARPPYAPDHGEPWVLRPLTDNDDREATAWIQRCYNSLVPRPHKFDEYESVR